jgi:hypothetical protein
MFWEAYHYGHDDYDHDDYHDYHDYHDYNDYDGDCEWKEWYGQCSDFSYHQEDGFECDWYISYSPCEHDFFVCQYMYIDEYNNEQMGDCTEDFTNEEQWAIDREEDIWHKPENQ